MTLEKTKAEFDAKSSKFSIHINQVTAEKLHNASQCKKLTEVNDFKYFFHFKSQIIKKAELKMLSRLQVSVALCVQTLQQVLGRFFLASI